jgi:hypothetical protein
LASEEDPQVAPFTDLASVKFAVSVGAVYSQLDPAWLVVTVLAQATRIVLLVDMLALSHLLLHFARVVLLRSQLGDDGFGTHLLGRYGLQWFNVWFVCQRKLMVRGQLKGNLQIRYFDRRRNNNRSLAHGHRNRHAHWRTLVRLGPLNQVLNWAL